MAGSACGRGERRETGAFAEQEAVLAELRQYYTDFSARDWAKFEDHFWPGATLATVWQPPGDSALRVMATTVPDFVRQAPMGPGSKPIFEERLLSAEVRGHHNLAHVWAHYEVQFGDSARIEKWRGIDAITLLRHAGRWRITSVAYTDE